jgi:phosphate transport system protein
MTTAARPQLHRHLLAIQDDVLRMGSLIDGAVAAAMRALEFRDTRLARQIIAADVSINNYRFDVEEACLTTIATQQPTAADLRCVVATIILASELERMGDYAAGIARAVLRLDAGVSRPPLSDLPPMADACRGMLRRALDAYVARDAGLARAVAAADDVVDNLYNSIFSELMARIVADPACTTPSLQLLFSAHNLERIGDRAVNVAERVVFMVSGELRELSAGPAAPL